MSTYEVDDLPDFARGVDFSILDGVGCPGVVIGIDEDDGLRGGRCCPLVHAGHQLATIPLVRITLAEHTLHTAQVAYLLGQLLRQVAAVDQRIVAAIAAQLTIGLQIVGHILFALTIRYDGFIV